MKVAAPSDDHFVVYEHLVPQRGEGFGVMNRGVYTSYDEAAKGVENHAKQYPGAYRYHICKCVAIANTAITVTRVDSCPASFSKPTSPIRSR